MSSYMLFALCIAIFVIAEASLLWILRARWKQAIYDERDNPR